MQADRTSGQNTPRVRLGNIPASWPPVAPTWFSDPEHRRWMKLGERRKGPFLGSRLLVRGLLADQLGGSPGDWALSERGQPLKGPADFSTSISHHDSRAVAALSESGRGLGVDLERPRPQCQWMKIARRWFAPSEQRLLAETDPAQAETLFYRLWTIKEAWVKATGQGLAGNFDAIRVSRGKGGSWLIHANTLQTDWQVFSGWAGEDCLTVVWQGQSGQGVRIETAQLTADNCKEVQALALDRPWAIAITAS